jgi:hypothetical protein
MSVCVVYIDESGNPDPHRIPVGNGETPIFTLSALALPIWEWRGIDREYLALKRRFFPDRLGRPTRRDEETEIKGNDLVSPRNAGSTRRHAFLREVISFIHRHSGRGFGVSFLKNSGNPAPPVSLYTSAFQILVERISIFVTEHPAYSHALLICDSRMKGWRNHDIAVARSHMSYIFGHETGRTYINISEAPLFADSRITTGIQLCDIFSSILFANHYHYHLRNTPGAIDYGHMRPYWDRLDQLQFKSRQEIGGFQMYGFRVVDQRPETARGRPEQA